MNTQFVNSSMLSLLIIISSISVDVFASNQQTDRINVSIQPNPLVIMVGETQTFS
jgi:hypothetical protein